MNNYAPFTKKQANYIKDCHNNWLNAAEGGKRAGKNVISILAFCSLLEVHPNKLHLVAGVTISTAKLNVIDCDGYGVTNFFEGRCREGKYKDRDCLYIQTLTGEKILLISGGEKANDLKKIKGNTYGMAYVTEANECHESFIKEVFDRTLSSDNRKIFFDLNPKSPSHWFYEEILDMHEEKQLNDSEYGYNHEHFTIFDNKSLSDAKIKKLLNTYDKTSYWYKADILGLRILAAGRVYTSYVPSKHNIRFEDINLNNLCYANIGVDFGASSSGSVFVLVGFDKQMNKVYAIDEYYRKDNKMYKHGQEIRLSTRDYDTEEIADDFLSFTNDCKEYFFRLNKALCDNAEPRQWKRFKAKRPPVNVVPCIKDTIVSRVSYVSQLLREDRLFISDRCIMLKEALENAIYDDKGERLDDGTSNIDSLDAFEYAIQYEVKKILR